MWKRISKSFYLVKLLILVVCRHYFPNSRRKFITFYNNVSQKECPIVTVKNGKLRGGIKYDANNEVIYSFQGIPYAKPPLGPLRFKAPQPAEPWTGIRNALCEGNDALCRHTVLRTIVGSEDCLTLNVYTPSISPTGSKNLKPVMFWIHGGGFTSGSGSTEVYGPEFLLTEDVVLVAINYRTGILGFLTLEDPDLDVPGNAGLKDMVMALKWVQENVENFCGDPNNVTIFGESAGAAAVHYLILSPMTKGLFHKAILQSGCALNIWARGRCYSQEIAEILGLKTADEKTVLSVLQDLPPDQVYKAAEKIKDIFVAYQMRPHGPVVERKSSDAFLTEDPRDIIKSGKYNHVPILTGFTSREGMLGEIIQKPKPFKPITNFELCVPYFLDVPRDSENAKQLAEKIKKFYYGDEEPNTENRDPYYLIESDNFFIREVLQNVHLHVQTSTSPIFLYKMSIETSLNFLKNIYKLSRPGVAHADDLGYLFKNLLTPSIVPDSDEDVAVKRFIKFWTNFAKYGNPNSRGQDDILNINWKPVDEQKTYFLDIGRELEMKVNPEADRMAFWEDIIQNGACITLN